MATDPHGTPLLPLDFAALDAVVFDIGGVFTYPSPVPVGEAAVALGLTAPDDDESWWRAHDLGVRALTDRWIDDPDEHSSAFWADYDGVYATALGFPASAVADLGIRSSWDWPHQPNIDAFHRLTTIGLPVAVVTNNDGTADRQLLDRGVGQVGPGPLPELVALADSGALGIAKPDPAIFAPVLEALATDPARTLYVGDTVHADVVGATRAGMPVVQLDPFDDHLGFDHHRLADLAALDAALRAAR